MERWIEVLGTQGEWHFVNPAQIVSIVLRGNKEAARGAQVETVTGTIETADPGSTERLRQAAFTLAGLNAQGEAQPAPGAGPQGHMGSDE